MGSANLLSAAVLTLLFVAASAEIPVSFDHGVASGDPLYDRVILWTRITPRTVNETTASYNVTWTVFSGTNLSTVVRTGVSTTNSTRDYTVKVDAAGLTTGIQYAFRFQVDRVTSDVGTFRLPPPPGQRMERLKMMLYSCSNWGFGYFNAYDIGSRYNLDFWVHLGDYYYEYGADTYPSPEQAVRWARAPRGLQPATEIETLSDYRARHALYREDRGLQALSASAALIALWDDHEFMNNVYENGGENQDPEDLDFPTRKMNAAQAYHEWMPIRDTPSNFYAINRTLQFGDLATMFVLEDRVTARTNSGENEPEGNPNNTPSASSVAGSIVGTLAPALWGQNVTDRILALKNIFDTRRTGANETMMGPEQEAVLARDTNAASSPGVNKTVWQQYLGGLVMQDRFPPDLEGAIAAVRSRGDVATASFYQQALDNLTLGTPGATYTSYSPLYYQTGNLTKSFPVTNSTLRTGRANLALGRYKVESYMDSWMGYIADRNRFLASIVNATNPVVYGGDTHNFWGGYIYRVDPQQYFGLSKTTPPSGAPAALEFDTGSVTSTGSEGGAVLPLEMINEAYKANNPGLLIADVRYHGGLYVELTQTNQHVEYVYVDTIGSENYTGFCGMAYDAPARQNTTAQLIIKPGTCGPVPDVRPYQQSVVLSDVAHLIPGNTPNASVPASASAATATAG